MPLESSARHLSLSHCHTTPLARACDVHSPKDDRAKDCPRSRYKFRESFQLFIGQPEGRSIACHVSPMILLLAGEKVNGKVVFALRA